MQPVHLSNIPRLPTIDKRATLGAKGLGAPGGLASFLGHHVHLQQGAAAQQKGGKGARAAGAKVGGGRLGQCEWVTRGGARLLFKGLTQPSTRRGTLRRTETRRDYENSSSCNAP